MSRDLNQRMVQCIDLSKKVIRFIEKEIGNDMHLACATVSLLHVTAAHMIGMTKEEFITQCAEEADLEWEINKGIDKED